MLRCLVTISLFAAAVLGIASSCAADDTWRDGIYRKRLVQDGEPFTVGKLFNDFGKGQRVPVILDQNVDPSLVVTKQYPEMRPEEYLDALTQDYGLFWYYSGGIIYVLNNDSLQSALLPIAAVDLDRLIQTLKRLGVHTDRLPITADPEYGLVYVYGPKQYINEVTKISQGIEARIQQRASVDIDVEVFPLRYAWADDQVFVIGQNEVAVPGVATIMRNVLSNNPLGVGLQGRTSRVTPYNRPGLRGRGLIGPYNQIIANAEQAALNSQLAAAQAEAQFQASAQAEAQVQAAVDAVKSQGQPDEGIEAMAQAQAAAQVAGVIFPDSRLNAIVVRDVRERMAGYRELIRKLDRPVGLVQIKASIIDVDANHAFQLGMPYNAIWRDGGRQRALAARLDTTNAGELLNTPDPGNLTIRLTDGDVNQFFLNLKALESDGHARTMAKPAVVTLDNSEAFLEESEEFYVRIAGLEQVDLFNVTVGTKLNIIPHIVAEPDGRRVKLTVRIEDGTRSATQTVDEIPVVSRNTINTQTVLLEGQSLLVGGLMREQETKDVRGIPVLARIPKLGVLFRETVHETKRLERMVLLTPTIIDIPYFHHCEDGQAPEGNPRYAPPQEVLPAPVGSRGEFSANAPPRTTVTHSQEQARRVVASRQTPGPQQPREALPPPSHSRPRKRIPNKSARWQSRFLPNPANFVQSKKGASIAYSTAGPPASSAKGVFVCRRSMQLMKGPSIRATSYQRSVLPRNRRVNSGKRHVNRIPFSFVPGVQHVAGWLDIGRARAGTRVPAAATAHAAIPG